MHVKRGLGEHEGAGIRDRGVGNAISSSNCGDTIRGGKRRATKVGLIVGVTRSVPVSSETDGSSIHGTSRLKKTLAINEGVLSDEGVGVVGSNRVGATKSMDGVGERINSISVVEGLSTQNLEEKSITHKG